MSSRAARAEPAPDRGEGPTPPTIGLDWEKVGLYWWKATRKTDWQYIGWAADDLMGFLLTFVMSLGAVPARGFPRVKGVWRTVLQQFYNRHIPVQVCLASRQSQWLDLTYLTVGKCVQHC